MAPTDLFPGYPPPADFKLMIAGDSQYVEQLSDVDGYRMSKVFGKGFRVRRSTDRLGRWQYHLDSR